MLPEVDIRHPQLMTRPNIGSLVSTEGQLLPPRSPSDLQLDVAPGCFGRPSGLHSVKTGRGGDHGVACGPDHPAGRDLIHHLPLAGDNRSPIDTCTGEWVRGSRPDPPAAGTKPAIEPIVDARSAALLRTTPRAGPAPVRRHARVAPETLMKSIRESPADRYYPAFTSYRSAIIILVHTAMKSRTKRG
jgi:hypothetical protein